MVERVVSRKGDSQKPGAAPNFKTRQMDYIKKRIAAERLSEQIWENTGVFFSPTEIINVVEAKEAVFEIKPLNISFPKEIKVANTRHARYGNTFLK